MTFGADDQTEKGAEHGVETGQIKPKRESVFMTNAEILMLVLTAVIAVTGVIGALIFNNQLRVMQGQLDEMRSTGEQTDRLIDTNRLIAEAAQKSANIAERAMIEIERAYIVIGTSSMEVVKNTDGSIKETKVIFNVGNYGRTIGTPTEIYAEIQEIDSLPNELVYSGTGKRFAGYDLISPGQVVPFAKEVFVSTKTSPFFFCGYINYFDIHQKNHTSRFCARIVPQRETWEGGAGGATWNSRD
jgi:hypothetical protein